MDGRLQLQQPHFQSSLATSRKVRIDPARSPASHTYTDTKQCITFLTRSSRFHCGQTIGLSTALGVATLFLTWRPLLVVTTSREVARDSLRMAAFTGCIYWVTGLTAILFPGTAGLDPEFGGPGFPQMPVFLGLAACGLTGSFLELVSKPTIK